MSKRYYLEIDTYSAFILVAKDDKIGIRTDEDEFILRDDIDGELSLYNTERVIKLYPEVKTYKKGFYEITDKEVLKTLHEKLYLRRKVLNDFSNACENVLKSLPSELRMRIIGFNVSMDNYHDLNSSIEWDDGDIDFIL